MGVLDSVPIALISSRVRVCGPDMTDVTVASMYRSHELFTWSSMSVRVDDEEVRMVIAND